MKIYQLYDGTLVGFYREEGFELQCVMYRDVYEQRTVTKMVEKEVTVSEWRAGEMIPGHWIDETRRYLIPEHTQYQPVVIEEHWEYKTWTEPAHWGTREYWLSPHIEIEYREVPGHYEIQPVWFEEHTITKYYWREPHPARGLPGAWIPYEAVVPAGYSDTRVWVDTSYEPYEVEIPGCWVDRRVWFPEVTRTTKKWVPLHEELQLITIPDAYEVRTERLWIGARLLPAYREMVTKKIMVEETTTEEVWVGYAPVYSAVDPSQATMFRVVDKEPAPEEVTYATDIVTVENVETGEELQTTAVYVGMATRIDDNEFVVP